MNHTGIDYDFDAGTFLVFDDYNEPKFFGEAETAVRFAFSIDTDVRVIGNMPNEKLIELLAAAIFQGETLRDEEGERFDHTPVPDASVNYITRKELGNILPDGWFIEVQLNRYSAMWGENMTLPARPTLAMSIADIHKFLVASIAQTTNELAESLITVSSLPEEQQLSMWLSTDSPKGAVENSTEVDSNGTNPS